MPDIFISPTNNKSETTDVQKHAATAIQEEVPVTETEKSKHKAHNHSKFSAFSLYPDRINFETKNNEEKVILMLRQHPIVNVKWIFISLLLLTGPTFFSILGIFSGLPTGFSIVITLVWYLITMAYAMESFFDWYFNVYFITTARIIDVDFFNLIHKRVSNAEIEMIQDVTYATGGVLRTLLNYGDVFIQTAAEVSEFDFLAVPNPEQVAKILDDLRIKV
jgi:hypothetical protein